MILIVLWILAIVLSVYLGNKKGHQAPGWIMGILLGWIGVIVMLIVSPTHEKEVRVAAHRNAIEAEARGEVPPQWPYSR
jgi:hypothetical protein